MRLAFASCAAVACFQRGDAGCFTATTVGPGDSAQHYGQCPDASPHGTLCSPGCAPGYHCTHGCEAEQGSQTTFKCDKHGKWAMWDYVMAPSRSCTKGSSKDCVNGDVSQSGCACPWQKNKGGWQSLVCGANTCACDHGAPQKGQTCTSDGARLCASCDPGYQLNANRTGCVEVFCDGSAGPEPHGRWLSDMCRLAVPSEIPSGLGHSLCKANCSRGFYSRSGGSGFYSCSSKGKWVPHTDQAPLDCVQDHVCALPSEPDREQHAHWNSSSCHSGCGAKCTASCDRGYRRESDGADSTYTCACVENGHSGVENASWSRSPLSPCVRCVNASSGLPIACPPSPPTTTHLMAKPPDGDGGGDDLAIGGMVIVALLLLICWRFPDDVRRPFLRAVCPGKEESVFHQHLVSSGDRSHGGFTVGNNLG